VKDSDAKEDLDSMNDMAPNGDITRKDEQALNEDLESKVTAT
jgi:hypothetical protein